ncbi:MAG: NAD(P)H-hydrate dehydratase [Nitrosopumilus sp. H8]|nr:MAG: NAD(P)H-hydrate dehydratase [Nitrosopumilus sp. H8]
MAAKKLTSSMVRKFVPARKARSRKGENGIVMVLGGSYVYHGAPILSSLAALRCGSDLVYTAVPKINAAPTRAASPDLIVIPLADQKLTRGAASKLLGALPHGLHSAAIGMGLAVAERGALLRLVGSLLDMDVRLSLDAGALVPEVLSLISGTNTVVTPHSGEFRRLFGEDVPGSKPERIRAVQRCAKKNRVTVLLKGPFDVISDGSAVLVHEKRTPAMTVGGTGDVLSGLVAGMLAKNRNTLESAAAASYVNGLAGRAAQKRLGLHMTASDLLREIPLIMKPFDRIA